MNTEIIIMIAVGCCLVISASSASALFVSGTKSTTAISRVPRSRVPTFDPDEVAIFLANNPEVAKNHYPR